MASFFTKYEDFQARVAGIENDPTTGMPVGVLSVINAGALDIFGFELEVAAADRRFDPGRPDRLPRRRLQGVQRQPLHRNRRFARLPGPGLLAEVDLRFGAQHEWMLEGGSSITVGAAGKYRSRMALAVDNTLANSGIPLESMYQNSYWLADARVVWSDASDRYTIGLYGQNLTDEVYKTDAREFVDRQHPHRLLWRAAHLDEIKSSAKY